MDRHASRAAAAALCLGVLTAGTAAAFEGRIVEKGTGTPIAGATVTIVDRPGAARTDADGRFTWQPDPPAPFEIVIVLPGAVVARPARVPRLDHAAVTTIEIDAVVEESVTVSGIAPSIDATPAAATTLLSGTDVARRAPANLAQALETVAGVNQVSEGQAAVPALRGLARGRTLILIDGARVTSERRVGPSASFMDPASLEGIDVARGPGSVAYGSDALGGVISVRTRHAEPGSPFRVRLQATGGTGIPERRGTLEASQGFAAGGLLVQAHAREADDYDGPEDGTGGEAVVNSGWQDRGGLVRFDHGLGPGTFSAGLQSDFARDVERPRSNSRTVRFYYPRENSHRLTLGYDMTGVAGLEKLALSAFAGTYEQRTDQDRFATETSGRSIERADVSAQDFQLRGVAETDLGRVRMEFGADVGGRLGLEALETRIAYDLAGELVQDETTVSIEDARRIDTGAFVQAQSALSAQFLVSGGLRADRVTTRNRGGYFGDRETSNSSFSGFAALTAGPFRGLSLTAQLAQGFHDPTLSDRYYRGPTGRGFITGNPELEPETSRQFDLAARLDAGAVRLAVYAYEYRIEDLIERYPESPDNFFFRNRGEGRLRGLELELQAALGRGFVLDAGAQLPEGTLLDDGTPLDDVSPPMASIGLRSEFGARGYAQLRVAAFDRDDRPGPSEIETHGHTVVDLGGGWHVTPAFELRAAMRNLLDADYYASPDPRWVYAPGRSASLSAAVSF